MSRLELESSRLAQWHSLVLEGQSSVGFQLHENIEHYLVVTLDAYTTDMRLSSAVIAVEYLQNIHVISTLKMRALRDVGDQCLLLSGLFPDRAKRKRVSEDYFMLLGQNAYHVLSYAHHAKKIDQRLFFQLGENFSELIQVLKAMRVVHHVTKM